jgi:tRNA1(Val) A37 N6-methylase TrmN6
MATVSVEKSGCQTGIKPGNDTKAISGFTRRERDAWSANELSVLDESLRPTDDETLDLILRAKVFLLQHRKGFRANTDSLTLAFYAWKCLAKNHSQDSTSMLTSVDLGAGNGLVSLLFGLRSGRTASMHLVELQERLACRAERNLEINGFYPVSGCESRRVGVHRRDLQFGLPGNLREIADVVLMNPPFYPPNSRTPPSNEEKVSPSCFLSCSGVLATWDTLVHQLLTAFIVVAIARPSELRT